MTVAVDTPDKTPDPLRNTLLRQVDWRFLLRQPGIPRALDLTADRHSRALRLVCETAPGGPGSADLVVLGYPSRAALQTAREALRPGGEVVCLWRRPMPAGSQRARRRLRRAGFVDARLYWPGPLPWRDPHFWLPLDSPAAVEYVLALRPARSPAKAALRPLWRATARAGALAPLCAVARAPGEPDGDELDALLPATPSWALLTGGRFVYSKVVGLPFFAGQPEPSMAVKFARVPEADAALDREAGVLRRLDRDRPELSGVPRVAALGHRAGRRALAQSAVHGRPMLSLLTPENFGELGLRVTRWLVELAGNAPTRPAAEWWPRLVGGPLEELERTFGSVLEPGAAERARRLLEGLGDLPQVPEHRDCAPWNVVLTAGDGVALLDWESAEPRGLPGCDLVYFLATAAFALEGSIEAGHTPETYARLFDASSCYGRVATACLEEYSRRIGLDQAKMRRLALLCWIVRCQSLYGSPSQRDAAEPTDDRPEAIERVSLRLVIEELHRAG